MKSRLDDLQNAVRSQKQQEDDDEQITAGVGNVRDFAQALKAYGRHNPKAEYASEFNRAADESLYWQTIRDWNAIAGRTRKTAAELLTFRRPKPDAFSTYDASVAGVIFQRGQSESLSRVLPYIKAIGQRDDGGERIERQLRRLFADVLVCDVWMIEAAGQRFYIHSESKPDPDAPFKYIVSSDHKTRGKHLNPSNVGGADGEASAPGGGGREGSGVAPDPKQ